MAARLLVIQHSATCPPGLLGEALKARNVELDVRMGNAGDDIPETLAEHDGLMVLGGAMGANDESTCPWLRPVKALIADTMSSGKPQLGVCLGHQLMAMAVGGVSHVNPEGKARGLTAFTPNAEGREDPLLSSTAPGSPGLQWNNDVVSDLPEQCSILATAPDGSIQAARFGPRAWGVQFHPEATPEIFRSWAAHRPADADWPVEALHTAADEFAEREAEVARAWEPLAARFADILESHSGGSPVKGDTLLRTSVSSGRRG
ncbi:MAG: type 1 glutamine amidotransferase [Ornithinimicrobium sp.]